VLRQREAAGSSRAERREPSVVAPPGRIDRPLTTRLSRAALFIAPIAVIAIVTAFSALRMVNYQPAAGPPSSAPTSAPPPVPYVAPSAPADPPTPSFAPPAPAPVNGRLASAPAASRPTRATARILVEQAKALAESDSATAMRRVQDALALDPKAEGGAELMKAIRARLIVEGEAALTSARNFDRFKRIPDAIGEYERAIHLLELVPGGHKDLDSARRRSAELKKPR
jgi:hypothetical protein